MSHHQRHQSLAGASGVVNGSVAGNAPSARLVLTLTGWRRRALFGLLLTLAVIVIINLSLTLWLLRSMQFSLVSRIDMPPRQSNTKKLRREKSDAKKAANPTNKSQ